MINRAIRIMLSVILVFSVLIGAYLGWQRHNVESASKTVELVMDLSDLKILSSLSNYSMDKLLTNIKDRGIVSIGVREETLPEASAMGEIYYVSGSGILRSPEYNVQLAKLAKRKMISGANTYILCTNSEIRKRIQNQMHLILPSNKFKNLGRDVFSISESDILLNDVGIGISEAVNKYLTKKGFRIIPRLWNDPRYEVVGKIHMLKGFDTIIFDGDEIMGYPDNLVLLSRAMKNIKMNYGCIEIVKQSGDSKLKALMNRNVVRVHSIPKDELKKMDKDEAILRFSRAAKERGIRLIYIRPFLPPQITENAVNYNLNYLSEVKKKLESSGFMMGKASAPRNFDPLGWQILVLGAGVIIGLLLLANYFIAIPAWIMLITTIFSTFVMVFIGAGKHGFFLEKYLSLIAAIVFPSYAVISTFSRRKQSIPNVFLDAIYMVMNVLSETAIGIILIVGLLANTSFMLGSQAFIGIKLALLLPIIIVGVYFFFKSDRGFDLSVFKKRSLDILKANLPVWIFLAGLAAIGAALILLARSGNFSLPVPGIEKAAREILEKILVIRPRTKEFMIGYPFLMVAAYYLLKGKFKEWLPVLLAIGTIGPVSFLNSFCHIHSPVSITIIRSINGMALGLLIGYVACLLISKYQKS